MLLIPITYTTLTAIKGQRFTLKFMRTCAHCPASLAGLHREDTRRFCLERCRKTAGNNANWPRYLDWRAEGRSLAWVNPNADLIDRAPDGAAFDVLTCRDQLGVRWSFPARGGFRLRPPELPQVPIKGRYELTFWDFNARRIRHLRLIAIGRAVVRIGRIR